jgi:hypothetical protein
MVGAGLAALPLSTATAVSTGRPIAVAVAADGTSYVGFATAGRLLRLTPAGNPDGSVLLDRADPVTALEVDPGGDLWVDYGASISELDPDGTLLTHFAHDPGGTCPADSAHDPARYGGLEVTEDAVYIAGRCHATVGIYGNNGDLKATIDLPGTAYPRGVAMAPAAKGLPARLYVSVPDAGKVYAYNAGTLRSDPEPAKTLVIQQHYGYNTPEPGAVVADEKGQLGVVDIANNAVYFYNGPEDYWFYRTLGHPPDPASDRGFLDRPAALGQVGDSFKSGFWVADSGNGRVQHWDAIGTTEWMTDATPPGDPGAPVNTSAPEITGAPFSGSTLTCSPGDWDGSPASYAVSWQRDGLPVGTGEPTYTVTPADVGSELTCVVTATGEDGASSAPVSSEGFPIPGADSPPSIVEKPVIQGQPRSGSVLRCNPGTWTDDHPTSYLWGWLRDGQLIAGTNAPEYFVVDNDISHEVTCRVAAVNANGTGKPALSEPVLIAEGGGGGGVGQPENLSRPSIVGQAAVGAVLYCDPGTWDNAPVFTYVWRRDGESVGGSEKDRYEVIADDKGRDLTCVVTGTNPSGSDQASSPPVTPHGSVDPGGGGTGGGGTGQTCRGTASVAINGGAAFARKPYVELKVRAPAGADAVTISNDAGFRRADTRPLTKSCLYRWTLDPKSSRTPKVVRVRFVGATSAGAVTDKIVLDSSAPRLKKVVAHWNRPRWAWVLKISATDAGTGLAKVQVGKSKGSAKTLKWGRPVANADSSQLRWVRVFDRAGNTSGWYHLSHF